MKKRKGRPKGSKKKKKKTIGRVAAAREASEAVQECLAVNVAGSRVYFTETDAVGVARV